MRWSGRASSRLSCLVLGLLSACGGSTLVVNPNVSLGLPPFVAGTTTATVASGGTLVVEGFGFSAATGENILVLDTTAVVATLYGLVAPASGDRIEQLTFPLPALAAGSYTAALQVGELSSNSFTLTITP